VKPPQSSDAATARAVLPTPGPNTTGSRVVRRVVGTQGSIQLLAALGAATSHARKVHDPRCAFEDYLVIHGLFAPAGREEAFAATIRSLAEAVGPWRTIVHLGPDRVEALVTAQRQDGPRGAVRRLHEMVGIDHADELYLVRNWQFCNELLINGYRGARKICYGDGIGIYFDPPYLGPQVRARNRLLALATGLRTRVGRLVGLSHAFSRVDFDVAYLSLPHVLGDRPPMDTAHVERATLLEILQKMSGRIDPDAIRTLRQRIGQRPTTFLVTSNLSEADRMGPEREIQAYRAFMESVGGTRGAMAVIKPHPREGTGKLAALKQALLDFFEEILILDEGPPAFAPFELLLLDGGFVGPDLRLADDVRVVTFSSACVSLALLFGARPVLGFGDLLVREFFRAEYVPGRLRHEAELNAAVSAILRDVEDAPR
jgi:Alpha-2,8-polysialyltransferase (POLYST)